MVENFHGKNSPKIPKLLVLKFLGFAVTSSTACLPLATAEFAGDYFKSFGHKNSDTLTFPI
jgi:hypothetical protein